jgi:acetyl-CoA carboxylase, biotin carboxylase subunit
MSAESKSVRKVLIANRGEIALRVLRTCEEMGVTTVAIYSDADRTSLPVRLADEAYHVGGSAPSESYLQGDRIIDIAKKCGADAIHPGFGFLSENAAFVRKVTDAGIKFVGPSPEAMVLMGDKLASRKAMIDAGVPVVPGTTEPAANEREALKAAEELGYPVMLKASAGGGGKGIRIVRNAEELPGAFRTASGEAENAFGDGRMYLEKFLVEPRHIEVQIIGDEHGNIYALGDRECSIQRRHQKMIEEAPANGLSDETRQAMADAAVRAAKAVDYVNAGTVEFLYSRGEFFFLEMNTRLQVEHAVTEQIFGIDIVEMMVNVAGGEKLDDLSRLKPRGHSIEVRINAEDPENNFIPSLGVIENMRTPGGRGVRIDSAVFNGMEVTPYYDSMVGKLISHGPTRDAAIQCMLRMLHEFHIGGICTNATLAWQVLHSPEFVEGKYDTSFLETFLEDGTPHESDLEEVAAILAVLARVSKTATPVTSSGGSGLSPWVMSHRARLGRGVS